MNHLHQAWKDRTAREAAHIEDARKLRDEQNRQSERNARLQRELGSRAQSSRVVDTETEST